MIVGCNYSLPYRGGLGRGPLLPSLGGVWGRVFLLFYLSPLAHLLIAVCYHTVVLA